MYKRIIQIAFILAGLGVVAYVYFKFSDEEKDFVDSVDALPGNCAFVMEVSSFEKSAEYTGFLKDISSYRNELAGISFNPMTEWQSILRALDSLRSVSPEWNTVLQKSHLMLGCGEQGRADSWIISLGLRADADDNFAKKVMTQWTSILGERNFKQTKIYESTRMQFAVINHCLVMTSTGSLMEDAIIHSEKKDLLRKDEAFMACRELIGADIPYHFYINTASKEWLQLDPGYVTGDDPTESHLVLSGYSVLSDSTKNPFSLAMNGNPIAIQNHIPSNTILLDVFNYEDFETGWKTQEEFFEGTAATKFWSQAWKDFGDTCHCDVNEAMLQWRSGEWGTAVIAINDSSTAEVAFFGIKDSLDAIQMMQPVLFEKADVSNKIYKLRFPQLFERNQNQSLLIESNYVKKIGEYLFVASTPSELSIVHADTTTLAQSRRFKKATKDEVNKAGRFIYQSEYITSPLPRLLLNMFGGSEYLASSIEHFKEDKYLVEIQTSFIKKNDLSDAPEIETTSPKIETDIAELMHGPWKVINHNTKEKETVFQNRKNEICLQSTDGSILWKKNLDSEILGDVVQVDALKNGKLQLVFTTQNALHLMDRNGNELTGFPIMSKEPITSPLHVADYDNNKKYRLLFATGDGMVMNYTTQGTITEGWKQEHHNVVTWIDDFKIGKEDYLMLVSPTGQLEFLKRTGEMRQQTNTTLPGYDGGRCEVKPGNTLSETEITYTLKSGELKSITIGKPQ